MDVYHKVLNRIYEETGGKDSVDVDLTELLKREGFYPSIENISKFLMDESWVTETSKQYVVRITHWGTSEAKKSLSGMPDKAQILEREGKRLISDVREFLVMLEEFMAKPENAKFKVISEREAKIAGALSRIENNL